MTIHFQPGMSEGDAILGIAFMSVFHVLFDVGNDRIGFANVSSCQYTPPSPSPTPHPSPFPKPTPTPNPTPSPTPTQIPTLIIQLPTILQLLFKVVTFFLSLFYIGVRKDKLIYSILLEAIFIMNKIK